MKKSEEIYVNKWYEYKNFIKECSLKCINDSLVYHRHHIIPKFYGGTDCAENLVLLSVEDHAKAHILFSECFEEGSYERIRNISSANILDHKSIRLMLDLDEFRKTYQGENNPFYGKTHTKATIEKIIKTKKENGLTNIGNTYEDMYGENSGIEKSKRSSSGKIFWDNLPELDRDIRIKAMQSGRIKDMSGKNNSFAHVFEVEGKIFYSWKEIMQFYGLSRYRIKKLYKITKIGKVSEYEKKDFKI